MKEGVVGLGGRQQAIHIETFPITHWNIAIECHRGDEREVLAALAQVMAGFDASFKEVGGGPTKVNGRRCPVCGKIIHSMSRDCGQCGKKDIR